MVEVVTSDVARDAIGRAKQLESEGQVREAIDLLVGLNRAHRETAVEQALVRIRRDGARWIELNQRSLRRERVHAAGTGGAVCEVPARELTVDALRHGLSSSGCLLVRGLVPSDLAASLVDGIDSGLSSYDAAEAGRPDEVDPAWFTEVAIRDRARPNGLAFFRKFIRPLGALWTFLSPRMLFDLFELIEEFGLADLMTEFLGERPVFSANKGTLRRVEPTAGLGGWHQDGAFLGDDIGALNFWLALSRCGVDAPGLDIVPKRFDNVLVSGEGAHFKWSLSDEVVLAAAGPAGIARPEFEAGDALLFDHLLVHRTAATPEMTRRRYAIESWFFAPSAYPEAEAPMVL